jgi:hypothetical protein
VFFNKIFVANFLDRLVLLAKFGHVVLSGLSLIYVISIEQKEGYHALDDVSICLVLMMLLIPCVQNSVKFFMELFYFVNVTKQ